MKEVNVPPGSSPHKPADITSTLAMCLILVRDAGVFLPAMIMPYLRKKQLNKCPSGDPVSSVRSQPAGGESPPGEQPHNAPSFEGTSLDTMTSQSTRRRVFQSINRWLGVSQFCRILYEVGGFAVARFRFRPTSFLVGVLNRSYILVLAPVTSKQKRLRKVAPLIHFCSFLLLLVAIHIRCACFCRRMSNAYPGRRNKTYTLAGAIGLSAIIKVAAVILMSFKFFCKPGSFHANGIVLKNVAHSLWGISLFPDFVITTFCFFTVWGVVKQMKQGGDAAMIWYFLAFFATASQLVLLVLFRIYGQIILKYTLVILACFEMSRSALDHLEEAGLVVDDEPSISTQISE